MRVTVASGCAIDTLHLDGTIQEQLGGDALYSGMTAKEFRADVTLQTRFGPDFSTSYIEDMGLLYDDTQALSEEPTTRFKIVLDGHKRDLYLLCECEPIDVQKTDDDAIMIEPIYHEITPDYVRSDTYTLLNPQGMLRRADDTGRVQTVPSKIDMARIDTVKVNHQEIQAITGEQGDRGMLALQKMGADTVIRTGGKIIDMLHKNMVYTIELPNKEIHDTTGAGAIFCGAFVCTHLKERDILWAFCFGGGAVQAALDSKDTGLLKVPRRGAVQTNASYFYNLVKYRQV